MIDDVDFKQRFGISVNEFKRRVFTRMCGLTDAEADAMPPFKSCFRNCLLYSREDDRNNRKTLVYQSADDTFQVALDGYAIIPKELYEAHKEAVEALRAGLEFYESCTAVDKNTREQLIPGWREVLARVAKF